MKKALLVILALVGYVSLAMGQVTYPPPIPRSYLSTDGTLAANSDSKVPTQKAVKTYADAILSGLAVANEATDTTCFPVFATAATGTFAPKSNAALTFNSNTGALGATSFVGAFTGNASTATKWGSYAGVAGPSQARTYTLPDADTTLAGIATTQTLTNKRITPRVITVASSATPTPDGDVTDHYTVTALAEAAAFGAPTGTPTDGQKLIIRVKDDGTARALSWNAAYRAGDIALPTTTTISKTLYCGFIYNSADSKWDFTGYAGGF